MDLHDIFASDGDCVFRNPCDFGEICWLHATGALSPDPQPVAVLISTSPEQLTQRDMGLVSERQSTAILSGGEVRQAMGRLLGEARELQRGDWLEIRQGEHRGRWTVSQVTPAAGDEIEAAVTWETLRSLGEAHQS